MYLPSDKSMKTTQKIPNLYSHFPVFEAADGYVYNTVSTNLEDSLDRTSRLYLPLEVDTEFYHLETDINNPARDVSRCLTVQVRGVNDDIGSIYVHPDSEDIARHPLFTSGFIAVEYLRSHGHKLSIERSVHVSDLPVMQVDVFAFFAVAELYRMFTGNFLADVNQAVLERRKDKASISMNRRLIAQTILTGNRAEQNILMPWILTIDNIKFQVALSLFDTCAVHGHSNYANFCANSGVKLKYKDNFTSAEKALMNLQYLHRPQDFDNYALGDLYNHTALLGNMSKFQTIYQSLNIESFFEQPRLTIGATVARIVRSSMLKELGLDMKDKKLVTDLCRYGTSEHIKAMKTTTAVYNAKVDGGRCRNNRPTDISIHRPMADVDIAGCYGNGLKYQDFPFGRPLIIDYPIKSDNNKCYSLKKFLKKFSSELIPGLWQARVSTPKDYRLKYAQDFLVSWIPPKDPSKLPTDTDLEAIDWFSEDNIGTMKVFTHEVSLALINQEFIDWLENTASVRQRAELLDKLEVVTAVFYPASERCDNVVDFFNAIEKHSGSNLCDGQIKRSRTKKITIEQECHSWMSVNLGDLLVISLLSERSKYDKNKPEEKSLNELYKLCINTIYGDMVSPFFDIGNVVVGNNITARARAMAWYMEKGLNGFQTITDGCAFELNQVVYPEKSRLTAETVSNPPEDVRDGHFKLKPIGNVERIEIVVGEFYTQTESDGTVIETPILGLTLMQGDKLQQMQWKKSKEWLALEVKNHLKTIFPNIPVIDKFDFEIKDIYDGGCFHGTANYKFKKTVKTESGKMRSYSKKHSYKAYTLTGDELQLLATEYKPSDEFLENLIHSPNAVDRSHPYIASKVLKTAEYKSHYDGKWELSEAFPGCTIENGRLLRECSLTQFTFQTYKQYQSWEREAKRLRDTTGQTYESWFLNDDGTLDMKAMVVRLNFLIKQGAMRFSSSRPTAQQRNLAREYEMHPDFPALIKIKHQLGVKYGFEAHDGFETVLEIDSPDVEVLD